MTADVFVVGALHTDVVVESPHLPAVDATVVGRSVDYRFGGKGGNQAVAAARFGANVTMAGQVGKDRFGRQLLDELDSVGVDRSQVRASDGSSGMSVAQVIAGARGPEMAERLRTLGPPTVIVTRGAEGLTLIRRGEGSMVLPAIPVRVVSTHGAGDSFVGALASEIAKGRPLMAALEFAQAAAALFVSCPVAHRNSLRRATVRDFMNGS